MTIKDDEGFGVVEPNGEEGECQCVRSHRTFIDKRWTQCRARVEPNGNGFCDGCNETHSEAILKAKGIS